MSASAGLLPSFMSARTLATDPAERTNAPITDLRSGSADSTRRDSTELLP